jgi:endogenous inhibitor of DNA gyrase (YacG/DUF329 family)
MILEKIPCPKCGKSVSKKNIKRHLKTHESKSSMNDEKHINAIRNGKKNTTNCIQYTSTRTTFISLDGEIFRPFCRVKIGDMNKAQEIRACGKEFSLYQEERTWNNRHKIRWVDEAEHGNPTYVPNNMLDRAIAAGVEI